MKKIQLSIVGILLSIVLHAQNTNFGVSSGTGGSGNSFFGYFAGNVATSADNSFFWVSSGRITTTGKGNTGFGAYTLYNNITGIDNTAVGIGTLAFNTASYNTGLGGGALNVNTTGAENTAVGYRALYVNSTTSFNTAVGSRHFTQIQRVETTLPLVPWH